MRSDDETRCANPKCGHASVDHDDADWEEFGILGQCFECPCASFVESPAETWDDPDAPPASDASAGEGGRDG